MAKLEIKFTGKNVPRNKVYWKKMCQEIKFTGKKCAQK